MKAVVDGFDVTSGRTSGSVRYEYTRQANAAAPTPATTSNARLITDDDLEALARLRLVVDRMPVHDRQRRRLDDSFTLALGDALPRVAGTGGVEADSVGMNVLRLRRGQPAERLQALRE